jgi:polyisoprenoid-binding protein YceI
MDVTMLGTLTGANGRVRTGWKGVATINRFDYDVLWDRKLDSGGLVVSKEVELTLRMEMIRNTGDSK